MLWQELKSFEDPNTPERIDARCKLAISVVQGSQIVAQLYDQAEHVKMFGRLPDQDAIDGNEYDNLPDTLVKVTLDRLRNNYNKILKRDTTPERLALLQKHKANIQKLQAKWRSLNPQE